MLVRLVRRVVLGWEVAPALAESKSVYHRLDNRSMKVGIFQDMYDKKRFDTDWEYRELRRMLSEAISGGYIEQIPVMNPNRFLPTEEWYRDKQTGDIYSIVGPEERMRGRWLKVDPK